MEAFANLVDCEETIQIIGVAGPFDPPTAQAKAMFEPANFIKINSTADLVHVERVMLAMVAAGLEGSDGYWSLVEKAKAFFKATPALLSQPWPHAGGSMYELHGELCRQAGITPLEAVTNRSCLH